MNLAVIRAAPVRNLAAFKCERDESAILERKPRPIRLKRLAAGIDRAEGAGALPLPSPMTYNPIDCGFPSISSSFFGCTQAYFQPASKL